MDKLYVNVLGNYINEEVVEYYLVSHKEMREGTKDKFIRMKLSDKTGSVTANIWNNAKHYNSHFKEGDIVKVKGIVIKYREQVQITINKIRTADEAEYDLSEFIPATGKDIKKLGDALFYYIDKMEDIHLKELLHKIFDDKEFLSMFCKAPAAKTWHHNYMGGLLEHTISVAKICDFSARMYPVQSDLLITGALLHDIGKVYEYNMKSTIDFSTIGRLIGHICLGDELICRKAREINNFPENTLMKLRHLILAHHGEYEKASARLPQMLEAVVLHYADNLDAQTVGVTQLVSSSLNSGSEWSEYDKLNNRYFYLG